MGFFAWLFWGDKDKFSYKEVETPWGKNCLKREKWTEEGVYLYRDLWFKDKTGNKFLFYSAFDKEYLLSKLDKSIIDKYFTFFKDKYWISRDLFQECLFDIIHYALGLVDMDEDPKTKDHIKRLKDELPDEWEEIMGEKLSLEDSRTLRKRDFVEKNKYNLMTIDYRNIEKDDVYVFVCVGGLDQNGIPKSNVMKYRMLKHNYDRLCAMNEFGIAIFGEKEYTFVSRH